jgi:FkbM family methyltransferase
MSRASRVLDLGANRGAFAGGIRRKFDCHVVAVEPNPALHGTLGAIPGLSVLGLAVAAQSGRMDLRVSEGNSEASSLLKVDPDESAGIRTVGVEAVTLHECLERIPWETCDLVKMDIEGAEVGVLDTCSDQFLTSLPQFTVEFHDFCGITPSSEVRRIAGRFQRLGFSMISVWRVHYGDVLFVQRRKAGVSLLEFLFAKYWLRNWWGLLRVVARAIRPVPAGAVPRSNPTL